MTDYWDDTFAVARARADQHLAALQEQEEATRTFMRACIDYDAVLQSAGIERKQRACALVNLALGAAVTE